METFQSICILGRQPALGLAEIERLFGAKVVASYGTQAALVRGKLKADALQRLGGSVKIGRVLATLPSKDWPSVEKFLRTAVVEYASYLPEGKVTFGLSAYGIKIDSRQVGKTALNLKKLVRETGRSVRIIPNSEVTLSSAQVIHNKLTTKNGLELLVVSNGAQTVLAQTIAVQDIEAYAARDQSRPSRDARVGMLPPKLAQIIINLANPSAGDTVLDPFCGTGVVLQEALLMGYAVYGSDIDERMVRYSRDNIERWLLPKLSNSPSVTIEQADATKARWEAAPLQCVASEVFLGQPLSQPPNPQKLSTIIKEVNALTTAFMHNIAGQLPKGAKLCLALPAWSDSRGQFTHLPLLDQITGMGYNRVSFVHVREQELLYHRPNQVVARELVVLEKL